MFVRSFIALHNASHAFVSAFNDARVSSALNMLSSCAFAIGEGGVNDVDDDGTDGLSGGISGLLDGTDDGIPLGLGGGVDETPVNGGATQL